MNQPTKLITPAEEEAPVFLQSSNLSYVKPPEQIHLFTDPLPPLTAPTKSASTASTDSSTSRSNSPPTTIKAYLADQLYVPRTAELQVLQQAFASRPTMCLITGPCGTGKTTLAKRLRATVETAGGYMVSGKFDWNANAAPYTAVVSAFEEYLCRIKSRDDAQVTATKAAIVSAVGTEGAKVLTTVMPGLKCFFGKCGETASGRSQNEALQRFIFFFQSFVRAVCSPDQPLVILLDDLQYADKSSLDMIARLALDQQNNGLLLIGTCDNSVTSDGYLSRKLREIEDRGGHRITNIQLGNLSEIEVDDTFAMCILEHITKQSQLTKLLYEQTHGNLFYMKQYLRWLQDSDLLELEDDVWMWDKEEVLMSVRTPIMEDFLVHELGQLEPRLVEILKVASCLGERLNLNVIEYVLGIAIKPDDLQEAIVKGALVNLCNDGFCRTTAFAHDIVQRAAYKLIPEAERELFHLEIGRRIWRKSDEGTMDRHIFIILTQIKHGYKLITRENEKLAVANLCLHAGRMAAQASNFVVARTHLELGVAMLDEEHWTTEYDLSLVLYNTAAEMCMCLKETEKMNLLIDAIFQHAKTHLEKIPAYCTRVYALGGTVGCSQAALELGKEALKGLGEEFPHRLCTFRLMKEITGVKKLLCGKSDEQILRMPTITDEKKLACLQILHLLFMPAMMSEQHVVPYISLMMLRITMENGLSSFSSLAFSYYGLLCISAHNKYKTAFRYGELALQLLERFQAKEMAPRVYLALYGCIYARVKPLQQTLEPLMMGYSIGMQTGDIAAAALCSNLYTMNALESGTPLDVIKNHYDASRNAMASSRQDTFYYLSLPLAQAIHHYIGLSPDPLRSKGDLIDYNTGLQDMSAKGIDCGMQAVPFSQLLVCYTFNNYQKCEEILHNNFRYLKFMPPNFMQVNVLFVGGLTAIQCARDGSHVRKNKRLAKHIMKRFYKNYARASPENCLGRYFLLQAESASLYGRNEKAFEMYVASYALAESNGHLYMQALTSERLARHLFRIGDTQAAVYYFERSCKYWKAWGGVAKLDRLEAEVKRMYQSTTVFHKSSFSLLK
jgi:predicted ATPase